MTSQGNNNMSMLKERQCVEVRGICAICSSWVYCGGEYKAEGEAEWLWSP